MKFTPFFFAFFLFQTALAQTAAPESPPAVDRAWLKLLHFQPGLWWGLNPEISSPNFYIHHEGRSRPDLEYTATRAAFLDPKESSVKEEFSYICRFPARYAYFRKKEPQTKWVSRSCPVMERWAKALQGVSASLVFSSYFLNNPSSVYGHTFLRINKSVSEKSGRRYELLDYGFNFAAEMDTKNPLLYAIKGIGGGFAGTFTTVPYYYKVREYSNSESRDLWEYELNVTKEQTDMLVLHIWELGPTFTHYYYFTENCSYFMLSALEAVIPDLQLVEDSKWIIIPVDTLKTTFEYPGLLKSWNYRPSTFTELTFRTKDMSNADKSLIEKMGKNLSLAEVDEISDPQRKVVILDALMDWVDYLYPKEIQQPESGPAKFKNQVLLKRSGVNVITEPLVIPPPATKFPHQSHGSRKISFTDLNSTILGRENFLDYKFALHDLLDNPDGYPDTATINTFNFRFGYSQRDKNIYLDQIKIFELLSLFPIDHFARTASWGVSLGWEHVRYADCFDCMAARLGGQYGATFALSKTPGLYSFFGIKYDFIYTDDNKRSDDYKTLEAGGGPAVQFLARWNLQNASFLESWYRKSARYGVQDYREIKLTHQVNYKNWALAIQGTERFDEEEFALKLSYLY